MDVGYRADRMKTATVCMTCRARTRPAFGGGTEHTDPVFDTDCADRRGDLPIRILTVQLCDASRCDCEAVVKIDGGGAVCSGHSFAYASPR